MPRMTCPACGKPAITFSAWGRGTNPFRTRCMNCGALLKGNKTVVWGFVLTVAVLVATILLVIPMMPKGADDRPYRFLVVLPPALVCAAAVWWLGGYELREK